MCTSRGGCALPPPTARISFIPFRWSAALSSTVTSSPAFFATSAARLASTSGVSSFGGSLMRSRAMHTASPTAWPRATASFCSLPTLPGAIRVARSIAYLGTRSPVRYRVKRYAPSTTPSAAARSKAPAAAPEAAGSSRAKVVAFAPSANRALLAAITRTSTAVSASSLPRPTSSTRPGFRSVLEVERSRLWSFLPVNSSRFTALAIEGPRAFESSPRAPSFIVDPSGTPRTSTSAATLSGSLDERESLIGIGPPPGGALRGRAS